MKGKFESSKSICELYAETEHESVVLWSDPSCDYRGIIAIHNTALGPAVGGTRFWNYPSDKDASLDALRLSRTMSYKNALAGLPFGGGKAVMIGDYRTSDRERIFRAHGRFIESLGGRYITAEDIGTTPADMEFVRRETAHVAGLPAGSGDPSPVTAYGVFQSLKACAQYRWGSTSLNGRTVAIQGCGSTGYHLAKQFFQAGAKLIVTDIDAEKVQRVINEFGATAVLPNEIFCVESDIFAPCAFGEIINDQTISKLKVEIIVGSANNQLHKSLHGEKLHELGILYAPDYVANAGGMINGCRDLLGWDTTFTLQKVDEIYMTTLSILNQAREACVPPFRMADRLAEERLLAASTRKTTAIEDSRTC